MTKPQRTANVPKFPLMGHDHETVRHLSFLNTGISGSTTVNSPSAVARTTTGSKLLDSLKQTDFTLGGTTTLFENGLGLQNLELPTLNSTPIAEIKAKGTAREQAVSRIARTIRTDRDMIA